MIDDTIDVDEDFHTGGREVYVHNPCEGSYQVTGLNDSDTLFKAKTIPPLITLKDVANLLSLTITSNEKDVHPINIAENSG